MRFPLLKTKTKTPKTKMKMKMKHSILASMMAAAYAMMPGSADAATIAWGSVSLFNDFTDVNANGLSTTVSAGANYAGTVNGVLFTDQQPGTLSSFADSGNFGPGTFLNDTGSSAEQNAFDALVGTANWNDPTVPSNTISLSGLTVGQAYRIQAIFADDRSTFGVYALTGTLGDLDGGTPSVSIKRGVAGLKASGNTIYGDFTADADGIQEFTVNGNIQMLTGYVLTTVPEPSSALLGGLGLLALLRRRR
jgi:MYXO-CTERM domain-containing protein